MPTTIEITTNDSAAGHRVAQALIAQGAAVTHEDGVLRIDAATAVCAICGGIHAAKQMKEKRPLGGLVCPICLEMASRIYRAAQLAASRQMKELVGQLPQMVRDLRGGADMPTFYRGYEG